MKYLIIILLSAVTFAQDVNKIVIDEESGKAMLVGITTSEAFEDTSFSWWFNSGYEFYEPDLEILDSIEKKIDDVEITVILGTWCSDSRREVPHLFNILDYIGFQEEKIELISVDRDKKAGDVDISDLDIEFVPTFIFYRDGKEIGRIIESPAETLEKDISRILD